MEETGFRTTVEVTTVEADKISEKTSNQSVISGRKLSASEEAFQQIDQSTEDGEDVKNKDEDSEGQERERKKKRREEKRLAQEKLNKHLRPQSVAPEQQVKKKKVSLPEVDGEEETQTEIADFIEGSPSLKSDRSLEALKSSLVMSDTEDVKTAVSSSEDESDYTRGEMGVSFKEDFLEYFYLPSFSDVSSELSDFQLEVTFKTVEETRQSEISDKGHFVNPLTGETESSTKEEVVEEQVKEESEEEESSTESEFEWPFDDDEDLPVVKKVEAADLALEMLLDTQQSKTKIQKTSTTEDEQQRAMREVHQIANDFLNKLINDCVDTAEYIDPIKVLYGKLDKMKLYTDLHNLYTHYLTAQVFNKDVNSKMYDYYRRVGQLRCFDRLPPNVDWIEYKRYVEAMNQLDFLIIKAEETKKNNAAMLSSIRLDLDYAYNIALKSVNSLENCFRDTLIRKDTEHLPRLVENELRRMQILRNEVSDSRLFLITRQHTLGNLVERKRNFDEITEDLTMDQFLVAQRDVTSLGTKVSERTHELNRMRDRCTKHMHQLAFIREKTSMNSATLISKKIDMAQKIEKREQLRDQILKLKLKHASLKIQKKELHEKCGLHFKPALLHDFDATVELIETKTETVRKLRNTVADLESRIAFFENQPRDSDLMSLRPTVRRTR